MRHRINRIVFGATLIAMALSLTTVAPAAAQSDAELRRENQRLQSEVERLQRELEAARQRMAQLEATVTQLQEQIARGGTGVGPVRPPADPPEEEQVSIDESQLEASPRSVLSHLQASYEETFGKTPQIGAPGSREYTVFMRELERWAARMARELRAPIEWHVRIVSQRDASRTHFLVELQAVDPQYPTRLGEPFTALILKGRARNVTDPNAVYIVRGTMNPQININVGRMEPGPFDSPRFIGPFAEFGLHIDVQSIVMAK